MARSLIVALIFCQLAAAQDAPTTAAANEQTLLHGQVVFTLTDGWESKGKYVNDQGAGFELPGDKALLIITAVPQTIVVPSSIGPKLAVDKIKAIKDEAAKGNIEAVMEPKSEPDKRFLLRIHDKFRGYGKYGDRLWMSRAVGKTLVSVVITAFTEDPAEAKSIHEMGEKILLSARLEGERGPQSAPQQRQQSATTKPVTFAEARLRVAPPAGWRAEPTGRSNGIIVTWRDPADSSNLITLTYRPIPAEAKKDPKLKEIAIDQIAAGEKPTFKLDGNEMLADNQNIKDSRFIRKVRSNYKSEGMDLRVGFRQVKAGDGVASITSVASPESADSIDALADKVATEVRSTGN